MKFLHNLEAFRTAIPTIHTLRLCNQFGTGENAGITQLTKELIGFIEEALLAMHRRRDRNRSLAWTSTYRCYEGACRAREHGVHVNFEIYADSSEDDGLYQGSDSDSEMDGGEYVWEICWEQKAQWQDDLRKHMEDNGNGDVSTAFKDSRVQN